MIPPGRCAEHRSWRQLASPQRFREALGRRLDRLSEDANELLTVAAVIGREFTYETLTLLGERDDEVLLQLVEEGLDARDGRHGRDYARRIRSFLHLIEVLRSGAEQLAQGVAPQLPIRTAGHY